MKSNIFSHLLISLAVLIGSLSVVHSHTYLLRPTSRYRDLCMPALGGNGNCCASKPSSSSVTTTYQRGQSVRTEWGRNNHLGGFIQYAIVPLADSDRPGIFERPENVFVYHCYASSPNCVGAGGNFFAGDPGGTGYNGIHCYMNIPIPDHLPDGHYTFRWRWFAGGDSYDIRDWGLVDFVGCHDFRISGGPLNQKPSCPLFIGGDAADWTKNACEFFKSNDINACTNDRNCVGWFAKAAPKQIMQCPSNILPGGAQAALAGNFTPGTALPLYVGDTEHPLRKPDRAPAVNLDAIRAQYTAPSSSSTSSLPSTSSTTRSSSATSTTIPSTTASSCRRRPRPT